MKKILANVFILTFLIVLSGCNDNKETDIYHTVEFEVMNSVISTQEIKSGDFAIRPVNDPLLEEQEFIGWFLEETEFKFAETPIKSDITLKASFEKDVVEVKFFNPVTNMAYSSLTQSKIKRGSTITLPKPNNSSSYFINWCYDKECNNAIMTETIIVTENLILYDNSKQIYTSDWFKYIVMDDEITVISANSTPVSTIAEIPSEIDGKKVISIKASNYANVLKNKFLVIPSSIENIEKDAFANISNLSFLAEANVANPALEEGLRLDENNIFYGYQLHGLIQDQFRYFVADNEVIIYQGLNSARITIPESINSYPVTTILKKAFIDLNALKEVVIPSSLIKIGSGAFNKSSLIFYLKAGTMPSQFEDGWTISTKMYYDFIESNTYLSYFNYIETTNGIIITKGNNIAENLDLNLKINEKNIIKIEEHAFSGNTKLKEIILPASLTIIGKDAFKDLNNLIVYLNIAEKQNGYDDSCFTNTSALFYGFSKKGISGTLEYLILNDEVLIYKNNTKNINALTIPEQIEDFDVTGIYKNAFRFSLETNIYLPESIVKIDKDAFLNSSTKTIFTPIEEKDATWNPKAFPNTMKVIYGYLSKGTIAGSFDYYVLKSGVIITKIYYKTNIEIPEEIEGKTVFKIASDAFPFSGNLAKKDIFIPETVVEIEKNAFKNESYIWLYYKGTEIPSGFVEDFSSISLFVGYISKGTHSGFEYVKTTHGVVISRNQTGGIIPSVIDGVTVNEIGNNAFKIISSGATKIAKYVIPSTVTKIPKNAFYSGFITAIYLEHTSIPAGFEDNWNGGLDYFMGYIGENTLDANIKYIELQDEIVISKITYTAIGLNTMITIPNVINHKAVTTIGHAVMDEDYNQTEIFIPESIEHILAGAFYRCLSKTFFFEADELKSGYKSNWEISLDSRVTALYFSCQNVETYLNMFEYIISNNEVIIYSGKNIANVVIPSVINSYAVTMIFANAFKNNTNLQSITLTTSIKEIQNAAFVNCSNLLEIFIPISVTTIGAYAFNLCSSLTIKCEASSKQEGWDSNWNFSNRLVNYNC